MSQFLYKTYFKDNLSYTQMCCFFPNMSLPTDEKRLTDETLAELYASPLKVERYKKLTPPEPTPEQKLIQAKVEKKNELTSCRDNEEYNNVITDKGEFEFDALSRTRLSDAMMAMNDTDTRNWTCVNGTVVSVTKADIQDIFATANQRSDMNYTKLQMLKTSVDNCATIEEVNAIVWETDIDA